MVKRHLPLLYILCMCIATIAGLAVPKTSSTATEIEVIPNEAIRLRILANSDKEKDQALKLKIRDAVNEEINTWVAELTSVEEARRIISSRLDEIEAIAVAVMEEENNKQSINVQFGETVFPTKLYGQYLYPAGKYQAIKITLGAGEGENWWCVLFPPLCFLDFDSGTAVEKQQDATQADGKKAVEATVADKKSTPAEDGEQAPADTSTRRPVYEERDEEPVKVQFFLAKLFADLF